MSSKPNNLAHEHWTWVEELFSLVLHMFRFLYKTAFIHGYKHGYNDASTQTNQEN